MNIENIINKLVWYIPLKKIRNIVRDILLENFKLLEYIKININTNEENFQFQINNNKEFIKRQSDIISDMILYKDKEKIFYLQTPDHGNLGDHAIAYAATKLLKDIYPNKIILDYTYNDLFYCFDLIAKFINDSDTIYITGGGNMGNLYITEENMRRKIIKKFINNKIIIFPVSITFTNDKEGNIELELSKEIYNCHRNLTIMVRDKISYEFAKKHFNSNILLSPDLALYLSNSINIINNTRKNILFVLRNDKEKILDDNIIEQIKNYISSIKENYNYLNTHIGEYRTINKCEREEYIFNILNEISHYKLCITDRFHGLIFSYITNTPCIVFKSLDHKIESGVEWFNDINWIYKVSNNNIDEINNIIKEYLTYNTEVEKNSIKYNKLIKNNLIKI